MSELHIVDEINEIVETIEARARPHDCAGLHCATCAPAETVERLSVMAERVRLLDDRLRGHQASIDVATQELARQSVEIQRLRAATR